MPSILAVDTSADETSAAVVTRSGRVLECANRSAAAHNEDLAALVAGLLDQAGLHAEELDCFAVGAGPGSFTGLRVGFSFMKGMALYAAKPLLTVSSLAAYACEFKAEARLLCALADARRSECFCALYAANDASLREVAAPRIIPEAEILPWLTAAKERAGIADGDLTIASVHPRPVLADRVRCMRPRHTARSVAEMARVAQGNELLFRIDSLAEHEPHYLRAVAAKTIAERERERSSGY